MLESPRYDVQSRNLSNQRTSLILAKTGGSPASKPAILVHSSSVDSVGTKAKHYSRQVTESKQSSGQFDITQLAQARMKLIDDAESLRASKGKTSLLPLGGPILNQNGGFKDVRGGGTK